MVVVDTMTLTLMRLDGKSSRNTKPLPIAHPYDRSSGT